jgi:hypothetical protein
MYIVHGSPAIYGIVELSTAARLRTGVSDDLDLDLPYSFEAKIAMFPPRGFLTIASAKQRDTAPSAVLQLLPGGSTLVAGNRRQVSVLADLPHHACDLTVI